MGYPVTAVLAAEVAVITVVVAVAATLVAVVEIHIGGGGGGSYNAGSNQVANADQNLHSWYGDYQSINSTPSSSLLELVLVGCFWWEWLL